jgi:hypothetical protein
MRTGTLEFQLTLNEAAALAGRVRPENLETVNLALAAIDKARQWRLSDGQAIMLCRIIQHANEHGALRLRKRASRHCPACGTSPGYWPIRRRGKAIDGTSDFTRPRLLTCWDLRFPNVIVEELVTLGFCEACEPEMMLALKHELRSVRAEIPEALLGRPCAWKRQDGLTCARCGWTGHRGQLVGKHPGPTWLGPREHCPQCSNRGVYAFNGSGFVIVPAEPAPPS